MAQNKRSPLGFNIRSHPYPWDEAKMNQIDHYLKDGLFDLDMAFQELSKDREDGAPWSFTRCPIFSDQITRLEHISGGPYTRVLRPEVIECWMVGELEVIQGNRYNGSTVTVVKHLHLTSHLAWATIRTSKLKWRCCCIDSCGEQVPPGVLWAARTRILRSIA